LKDLRDESRLYAWRAETMARTQLASSSTTLSCLLATPSFLVASAIPFVCSKTKSLIRHVGILCTLCRQVFIATMCSLSLVSCGGGGGENGQSATGAAMPGLSLVAGMLGGSGNIDGPTGRFLGPEGVAVDLAGNLYIADYGNDTIRKRTPDGVITTIAGSAGTSGWVDGIGSEARFAQPSSIALDGMGNIYVSDNNGLRMITPSGVVTTFVQQSGPPLLDLAGLAVDSAGFVYVAGGGANLVYKILPAAGAVGILAGTGKYGSADGPGAQATFSYVADVKLDRAGNVYVADEENCTIRRISPSGVVTTVAGTAGLSGAADGVGAAALFAGPIGIAVDATGTIYVADEGTYRAFNNTIRKISVDSVVSTLAGKVGVNTPMDGVGVAASFADPRGIAVDGSGTVFVADAGASTIRQVTPMGAVTTIAGSLPAIGAVDGDGSMTRFNNPQNVAVDGSSTIYVADTGNNLIRKITPAGVTTTLAGLAGVDGMADGTLTSATFSSPVGIALGPGGAVYVADAGSHLIRKISPNGTVVTVAGAGWPTAINGFGYSQPGSLPVAIAVDGSGNMYVADQGMNIIRKVSSDGIDSVLTNAAAPMGVAVDSAGNLYVSDSGSQTIRRITTSGQDTILAGSRGSSGAVDGNGAAASFNNPGPLSVDKSGNVYVADTGNQLVRRVTAGGAVTVIAGQAGSMGVLLGDLPGSLNVPSGMAIDGKGALYTTCENSVLKIQLP
jgi:sugar lactone lactonase YvrE